jgi:hypothetical protein
MYMMDLVENPLVVMAAPPTPLPALPTAPDTEPSGFTDCGETEDLHMMDPVISASVNNPPATNNDLMVLDSNATATVPSGYVDILELLRQLLPDRPDANFRSEKQRKMVELAVSRSCNFVGILPTGGGKSFVFMLPALIEVGYFTIVVISNLALLDDMKRKATNANIPNCQWRVGYPPIGDSRLVFMALETITSQQFHACVCFFPYFFRSTYDDFFDFQILYSTSRQDSAHCCR